jgi:hypothetical protein
MTKLELQIELKKMAVPFPEDATIQQLRTLYFSILKSKTIRDEHPNGNADRIEPEDTKETINEVTDDLKTIKKIVSLQLKNEDDIKTLKLYIIGVLVVSIGLSITLYFITRKK